MEALSRSTVFSSAVLGAGSLDWVNCCNQGLKTADEANLISDAVHYKPKKEAFLES